MKKDFKYIYFGTPEFSEIVLERMSVNGFTPALIVTTPDKPQGRKLVITPPEVKVWAQKHDIPVLQPEKLGDAEFLERIQAEHWDIFVVASYGKILPQAILDIPEKGVLNIHPSLLPKHRGPSPIHTAILEDDETGVSIMLMDEKMDHGPVIAQEILKTQVFPLSHDELERELSILGADILSEIIPRWVSGEQKAQPQAHEEATFTQKITKKDAELHLPLTEHTDENYRKILAFESWPKAYYFAERDGKLIRIVVKEAALENGSLKLLRVIPEGRKEMTGEEFERWMEAK